MGKVKVTEKPGWPYVLVNDFKTPPYLAYELVDSAGNKRFVRVLKGAPEEFSYEPVVLDKKRKSKIAQFLRDMLKNPLKYAEFMSDEWTEQLIRFLDLCKDRPNEVISNVVVKVWLKDSSFKKLIQDIRRNLKDVEEKSASRATEAVTEEQPSGSQECRQKRAAQESDDDCSDKSEMLEVERKKTKDQSEVEVVTLD